MRKVLPFVNFSLVILFLTLLACSSPPSEINILTSRAEKGEVKAQFALGDAYFFGKGVPKDYAEAVKWWRKAAEQGHDFAQHSLGGMYYMGRGVPQDYAEAAKCFRKAAERGFVKSQYNLGVMYSVGHGVPQDYVQSYFWASLAALESLYGTYPQATKVRDEAEKKLNPEKLMEAQRMTAEWKKSHPWHPPPLMPPLA